MLNQPTEEKALSFYFVAGDFNGSTFIFISPSYLFLLHRKAFIHLLLDEKIKLDFSLRKKNASFSVNFIIYLGPNVSSYNVVI